jgi:nucleotidyltransferase/DNA polymerase involved in DNA repair
MSNEDGRIFLAHKIKREIKEATKLSVSCGIACNKMLAKICAGVNKPDGMTYLDFRIAEIQNFMDRLPIRKIPGVGKINDLVL